MAKRDLSAPRLAELLTERGFHTSTRSVRRWTGGVEPDARHRQGLAKILGGHPEDYAYPEDDDPKIRKHEVSVENAVRQMMSELARLDRVSEVAEDARRALDKALRDQQEQRQGS